MRRNALKTLTRGGVKEGVRVATVAKFIIICMQCRVLSICGRGTWLPKSIVANNCHINNPSLLSTRAYAFFEGLSSNLFQHVLKGCVQGCV